MEAKVLFYTIQYINVHIQDEIILKDMAARFGYTEYYLTRKFKKETGMTLKEYIREQKLTRAEFLLKDPLLSAYEISEMLHFSSQSYFTKEFKKKYGMTPAQYQKNIACSRNPISLNC